MHAAPSSGGIEIETLTYPLPPATQSELIQLLRTEWTRTDYDWIEAMGGDYSDALEIVSVLVRRGGVPLATATVHFTRERPEVAVLGSVLTQAGHRGQGLAGRAIERALAIAAAAGCRVCLLGTTTRPRNLYHDYGFEWCGGVVMRCGLRAGQLEENYFAAGQSAVIRAADWGDLPGFTLLLAQRLPAALPDFLRGLVSARNANAERCLSNFPLLWHETAARDGLLAMMAGTDTRRVFGFGSVTRGPGPARRHTAAIDFATHENYERQLPALVSHLLDGCRNLGIRQVFAWVAETDDVKLACLRERGFSETARLPSAVSVADVDRDVLVLSVSP